MSEQKSTQDKTEEATEHKLKKSKKEGQVARSKDLATTVSLIVTLFALKFSTLFYFESLRESFRIAYPDLQHVGSGLEDIKLMMANNLILFMQLMLPLLVTPFLVVALSLIPGGWTFASKNFQPQLSRLDPISGLARIFKAQNLSELLKSIVKIAVLLGTTWVLITAAVPRLIALQRSDLFTAVSGSLSLVFDMMLSLMLVFVVFSLIDIPLQRFFFLKNMRMTKQERKEEHKNQEGRPEVKARIKQLQRQMLQRQIAKVIKHADVVITNPTHYAVAIKYDPKKAAAPYVIARGVDEMALYIRKLATAHQLEVLELPPLARAIYATTQVNQQIPAALYTAVAHVLYYILQLRAYRQGRRNKPQLPGNLEIPVSLANRA